MTDAPKPQLHIVIELEPPMARIVADIAAEDGETPHRLVHRLLAAALLIGHERDHGASDDEG